MAEEALLIIPAAEEALLMDKLLMLNLSAKFDALFLLAKTVD